MVNQRSVLWHRRLAGGSQTTGMVWACLTFMMPFGCHPPDRHLQSSQELLSWGPANPRRIIEGRSVGRRDIECLHFGAGDDCVLIMATIHGDEDVGTPLVRRLGLYLSNHSDLIDGRRIILLPVANPDGMADQTRTNARGVDLNRNFPATNYVHTVRHGSAALSEPESAVIYTLIELYRPRRIISIHQPLRSGHACIDYDGPAAGLAEAMSQRSVLPVEKLGGQPGSLGSYAGVTLRIPIITLELPKEAGQMDEKMLWDRFGEMLLAAIVYPQRLQASSDDAGGVPY